MHRKIIYLISIIHVALTSVIGHITVYTRIQFLLQLVDLVIKTSLKNFRPKTEVLIVTASTLQSQNGYSSAPIHRTNVYSHVRTHCIKYIIIQ